MNVRSHLKPALLFLASLGLLYVGRFHWSAIVEAVFPATIAADWRGSDVPYKLAWSGLWISVALVFATLIGHLLSPEFTRKHARQEMPALIRDLVKYGALIFSVAFILRLIWGDHVSPIIGALGVGGVVLGFALQETLSNFFAGLALLAEKPFAHQDWIRIGDKAEGAVENITWRATKIRTRDNDYLIFPNSLVAKEVIVNYRQPTRLHAIRLTVGASYNDPPDLVKKTLRQVIDSVPRILKTPAPVIYVKQYADFSINYELKCFIEDYDSRPLIEDDVMHRIWYAFRRAGIEIPFPVSTVYEHRVPYEENGRKPAVHVQAVLSKVPIFTALDAESLEKLTAGARVLDFAAGEPILRQGEPGDTMYALALGGACVTIRSEDGSERDVARLTSGEFFGEMSLLTGDPRTATVTAVEDSVLVEVSKSALLPILQAQPAVAERMAEVMAMRRQGLDRAHQDAAVETKRHAEVQTATKSLLGRIRGFFGL
jgi:small-conductance mechanosensitive channel/CRP-like cAMP-binding protein